MKDFKAAFGPFKNNPWYKSTPLTSIMRIWFDNKTSISRTKFIGYCRSKLMNDYKAIELIKSSGCGATRFAREEYIKLLNNGRTIDVFV